MKLHNRQLSATAARAECKIRPQPQRKSFNDLSFYGFCEIATAYAELTLLGFGWCKTAERVARRLLLVQLAAMAVYQLRDATDEKTIELMHTLAHLGGWSGHPKAPIGPTMLMRGALLFIASIRLSSCTQRRNYSRWRTL